MASKLKAKYYENHDIKEIALTMRNNTYTMEKFQKTKFGITFFA